MKIKLKTKMGIEMMMKMGYNMTKSLLQLVIAIVSKYVTYHRNSFLVTLIIRNYFSCEC